MKLFFILAKRSGRVALLLLLTVSFLLGGKPIAPVQAAPASAPEPEIVQSPSYVPIASVTLNVPANVMVGENFTFTATFSNTSGTASDVGYGPFIDILLPANGVDGNGNQNPPLDGVSFVSATYLGNPVTATVLTFPGSGAANTCVDHPYAVAPVTGEPLQVCGAPGDQLVVLQLPFGSFVPGQPPATVTITASLSNLADVGTPLTIRSRGGYEFGATPLNDWCCGSFDATILSSPSTNSTTWPGSPTTPRLFTVTKAYIGPEDETATGPNFPHQYTITVDIADGQTLTNLDVSDILPNNMQFVAFDTSTPPSTPVSTPSTSAPGGTLTRRFASVTGGAGAADATLTFTFYIPRLDSLSADIINPSTGIAATSVNESQATANWTPIDARDTATPVTGICGTPCHTLTDRSIATQKAVAIVNDTAPTDYSSGDTLEYTLNFQISDFFAFDQVILTDVLSDGQRIDTTFTPTLQVNGNGYTSAAAGMASANYTVDNSQIGNTGPNPPADGTDGTQSLIFRVSDELVSRGQLNGRLVGGCIDPVNGSNPPNCTDNDGPTTGVIVFRAIIQQNFTDTYPSGDASVDHGDVLHDALTVGGDVLNPTTSAFTPTGSTPTDGSAADATIAFGALTKSIYAINGTPCGTCAAQINAGINPGDTVTYRLHYTQPASNFEQTVISDFLPLPVFNAAEVATFSNAICGVPAAGSACLGPADTFHALTTPVPPAPTRSTDAVANTVSFTYADYDSTVDIQSEIDLLFTVTVTNIPFADGLFLTNQAHVAEGTTNAADTTQDSIIQILLNEPALYTTKAAVSTDNPNGVFTPAIGAPIDFNDPGTAGVSWSGGTISSDYIAAHPIDADLRFVDAGDLVRFAIVIHNEGHSVNGAYDISIRDTFQPGYVIPGGLGLNLQVYRGDGAAISYVDLGGGIFGTGIRLVDPGPSTGACQAHDATNGRNVIVITYDLQLDNAITLDQSIINTATLFNYAGTPGGPDFTVNDLTDTATVQPVTSPTKSIVTTSETHTSEAGAGTTADPRLATIGEIVRFRIVEGFPEGIVTNFRLRDALPDGLIFLNDGTARAAFVSTGGNVTSTTLSGAGLNTTGNETTVAGITPTFVLPDEAVSITDSTNTSNYVADNSDAYASGTDIYFKFGTANNPDRDIDSEYVILEFNAIVANVSGNTRGTNLDNNATSRYGASTTDSASSPDVRVQVAEASITFGKTIVSLPTPLDAGGVVQYQLSFANGTGANVTSAFDVHLVDTLPAQLTLDLASVNVTLAGGAAGVTNASAANNIDVTIATVPAGGSVTVTYNATIQDTVTAAQIITNTSASTWTSLPGSNGTNPNGTGSTTGPAGSETGERTGTIPVVAPNTYTATSNVPFTIASPSNFTKQLTATSATHTTGSQVAIGEVVTYGILLTFPEGTTPTDTVFDDLPSGLTLVAGTPQIITSAAASGGLLAENFGGTIGTQGITSDTTEGGSVTFAFTNVALPGDNNVNNDTLLLRFDAQVSDIAANITGRTISNSATNQVGTETPIPSTAVTITVVQPSITFGKTIVSLPTPLDAGGVVHYRITYTNGTGANVSTAMDVNITDTLAAALLLSSTAAPDIVITPSAGVGAITNNSTTSNINIVITSVPPGESVTVDFYPVIQSSVTPGQVISNIGNSTWTSLSGVVTGERTGANGPTGSPDNYAATSNVQFTIPASQSVTKQLTSTSATHTTGSQVAIGEVVTYSILLTFPEGTTPSDTVVDDLPTGLTLVAGTPQVITSAAASGGLLTADFNGTIGTQGITSDTTEGGSVTFAFTNVVLSGDNDTTNNTILLRFDAQVSDIAANITGRTISNSATNQVGASAPTTSNIVPVTVVQPSITFGKTIVSLPTPLDAGGVVHYRITYANGTGANVSTAMDVNITDALAAALLLPSAGAPDIVITPSAGVGAITNNSTTSAINIVVASVPAGESVTVDFYPVIQSTITPGQIIDNTGNSTWTSLSGVVTGERTGANGPTGSPDNYAATSNVQFTIPGSPTITKQIIATSASHTTGSNVAIGEEITYDILLTFPEGVTPSDSVVDTLPTGLQVVTGTPQVITTVADSGGLLTADFNGAIGSQTLGESPVTFAFTNVSLPGDNNVSNNSVVLRFRALVLNDVGNQNAGTLSNFATNQVGGASTTSNTVSATVVESVLNLTKQVSDANPAVGQVLTFTLLLNHDAASTANAFDVVLTDDIPTGLTLDLSSVNVTTSGAVTNLQTNHSANHIEVTADSVALGGSIQVTYQATVVASYTSTFQNTALSTWTSLPGTNSGERTGTGTPAHNDYRSTAQAAIGVYRAFAKSLVASNVTSTIPDDVVTIGEILTYQVVLTIPAGTTDLAIITDTLDSGLAFVDCATTVPAGAGNMHDIVAGPDITSSNYTFAADAHGHRVASCNHGTAATNNPQISNSGGTIRWDLGNVTNTGAAPETITLTYRVVVLDVATNVQNTTLDNHVNWTWRGGTLSTQASPSLRVTEPKLQIEKTVDPEIAALNSVVTYSIAISHTAESLTTAYDVVLTDGIPTGLALDPASVTVTGSAVLPAAVITTSSTQLSVYWSQFPLGATATVTFRAQFVGPSPIYNAANADWSSLQIDPRPRLGAQSAYNARSTERRFNPLDQSIDNYVASSQIGLRTPSLPKTGFAPGKVTLLPEQPKDFSYRALGDLWLEIPRLNVKLNIVGVPFKGEEWNLSWLGNQAGYLDGTAYPTHEGNSGITAHAYLADGTPGPFVSLDTLRYGDQIIIHLNGQRYIYEVRDNQLVRPNDQTILKHEKYPWLTLITCKNYSESLGDYQYRVLVRAVLVKVENE